MRKTRWLLLAAIVTIAGAVGISYRAQKRALKQDAPPRPPALAADLNSSAEEWHWTRTRPGEGRPAVDITARKVGQVKDASRIDLEHVEIRLFDKRGDRYNRVRSERAQFLASEQRLYSEGEVEITLGVPLTGTPARTLVSIRSSGVTFDSTTGKAATDRECHFVFANGEGRAVGASYDPTTNELHMGSAVELNWKAPGAHSKPMKLESGELTYKEASSTIWLTPWARLTRVNSAIESGPAVVTLEKDAIRLVEAQKAHGTDRYPNRELQYGADQLSVNFGAGGEVEKVSGNANARLVSRSAGAETTLTADRVDLEMAENDGESTLTRALANGKATAYSKPLPVPGQPLPEERILRSETIELNMRAGGREIEQVQTHAQGRLEFVPVRAGQHHRILDAERMSIRYGAQNRIQSFRAVTVRTETDPTAEERARRRGVTRTASRDMQAAFDPKTGQLTRMEQWNDFTYEEGDRKARAAKATLESAENVVTLETAARVWDATGSTSADNIRLEQRTGDFAATGHVNSSHAPEKKKPASGMLSTEEAMEAMAERMTSANRNRQVHYEGNVTLWQEANRLQADRVDIDREKRVLRAGGHVMSQFLEAAKDDAAKKTSTPVFTVVRASELVYTEQDRLAHYTGGVALLRPGLQVKAAELRAYLAESGSQSRMEKAYADGKVEIVQMRTGRVMTGTGEHGEYFAGEEKVVLRGGEPQLVDNRRGNTRGNELTYFANDDRLLVNGAPERPAITRIRKK